MPEYLEDMKVDHDNNFNAIMLGAKAFEFKSNVYAVKFIQMCFTHGMNKLGFDIELAMRTSGHQKFAEKKLDRMMKQKNIRVEDWTVTDHEEWKKGLYIYKDDEIAWFISPVRFSVGAYWVTTNVNINE